MNKPTDNKNKIVICQDSGGDEVERIAYFENGLWHFRTDNLAPYNKVLSWEVFKSLV